MWESQNTGPARLRQQFVLSPLEFDIGKVRNAAQQSTCHKKGKEGEEVIVEVFVADGGVLCGDVNVAGVDQEAVFVGVFLLEGKG